MGITDSRGVRRCAFICFSCLRLESGDLAALKTSAVSVQVVYDFAGPYTIGIDDMAFGKPTRYLQLDPSKIKRLAPSSSKKDSSSDLTATAITTWDAAVDAGANEYCQRMHNLFCDNCHSHVAKCLNEMQ
jgi:hypothetical protein